MSVLDLDHVSIDDINNLEFEGLPTDLDLGDLKSLTGTVTEPHIKVDTKAFLSFLKTACLVCVSSGRDLISKTIFLKVEGDSVVCRVTDYDVYVEVKIPLLNQENVLFDSLQLSSDVLLKLFRIAANQIIFLKRDDKYFVKLYGGEMPLECANFPEDKFVDIFPYTEQTVLPLLDFSNLLNNFSSVTSAAINPADKKIMLSDNQAYINYMWGHVVSLKGYKPFVLRKKDIQLIKALLNNVPDKDVHFAINDGDTQKVQLSCDSFKFSFLSIHEVADIEKPDYINQGGYFVDKSQLVRLLSVASDWYAASGKVIFSVDNDKVVLSIINKINDKVDFDLYGALDGSVVESVASVEVQAKLVEVLLRAFTDTSVKLILSGNNIAFVSENYVAFLDTK